MPMIVTMDSVRSTLLVDVQETETTLSECYLIVLRAIIMEKCSKVENIVSIAVNTSDPFWGCLVWEARLNTPVTHTTL